MFDIVSIGHATIDLFLELYPKTAPLVWSEQREDSFICLDFDDKTPVKNIHWSVGGNAVNSGIGFSRLGLKTALISDLGDDEWGKSICGVLEKENLDLGFLKVNPKQTTDLSVILNLGGNRTILSYHYPRSYQFPQNFPETRWIYLTSLGEGFKDFHSKLSALLTDRTINLAYNPGTHELLKGLEENQEIIKRCKVLIVNREEAGELIGRKQTVVDRSLVQDLRGLGSEIVVVTDGAQGAFAYAGEKFLEQEVFPASTIETTGAGDAFSSGLLAAMIYGKSLEEALRWGVVNSSSVIEKVGSTEGLLTLDELQRKLESLGNVKTS